MSKINNLDEKSIDLPPILKNNPHFHELNVDGDKYFFLNMMAMTLEQEQFYINLINTTFIWISVDPNYIHFIGNGKICSIEKAINHLKSDELLSDEFKEKHLRTIIINPVIYKNYHNLLSGKQHNDDYFRRLTCIDKMKIMKDIANEIFNAGDLLKSAYHLYAAGVNQLGIDFAEQHTKCNETKEHNVLLSQLYNDMSTICWIQKEWERSAELTRKALKWNPNYEKCIRRLKQISKIIITTKSMEKQTKNNATNDGENGKKLL